MGAEESVLQEPEEVTLPFPASWINPGAKLAGGQNAAIRALGDICELETDAFEHIDGPPELSKESWEFSSFLPFAQKTLELYPHLQKRIDKLVPKRMLEEEFWRLFYCHAYIATGADALLPANFKYPVEVAEPEAEPSDKPKLEAFKGKMQLRREGTTELDAPQQIPLPCPHQWIHAGIKLAGGHDAAAAAIAGICELDADSFRQVTAPADELQPAAWKSSSFKEYIEQVHRLFPNSTKLLQELVVPGVLSVSEFWRLFYCHVYIAVGAHALAPANMKAPAPMPEPEFEQPIMPKMEVFKNKLRASRHGTIELEESQPMQMDLPCPAHWINAGIKLAGGYDAATTAVAGICELDAWKFRDVTASADELQAPAWNFSSFQDHSAKAIEMYPSLQKLLEELVPGNMTESEFWRHFYCHVYLAIGADALEYSKMKSPAPLPEPEVEQVTKPKLEAFRSTLQVTREGTIEFEESEPSQIDLPCPAAWITAGVKLAGGYDAAAVAFGGICELDAEAFKSIEAPADELQPSSWKFASFREYAAKALQMYSNLPRLLEELVPGTMSKEEFWRLFYCHAYIAIGAAKLQPDSFKAMPPVPRKSMLQRFLFR